MRTQRLGRRLMLMLGLLFSLTASSASAATFRSIIVFEDSLSETGNVLHATGQLPGQAVLISLPYFDGHFSTGEGIVATSAVQGLVHKLTLEIVPVLDLLSNAETHLLVTLDIKSATVLSSVGSAIGLPGLRSIFAGGVGRHLALIVVFGGIGMLGLRGRYAPSPRFARFIVGFVVVWWLVLMSCTTFLASSSITNTTDRKDCVFAVSLPVSALLAVGDMSGAFNKPLLPIPGATIVLAP